MPWSNALNFMGTQRWWRVLHMNLATVLRIENGTDDAQEVTSLNQDSGLIWTNMKNFTLTITCDSLLTKSYKAVSAVCSSVVVSDTFSGYAPDRWQMKKWQFEPQSSHKSSNMNQSLFEKLFHCCKLQTHDFWMSLMFAVVLSAFCCRSSSRNTRTRTQMQPQRQNWHRTMVQKLMAEVEVRQAQYRTR